VFLLVCAIVLTAYSYCQRGSANQYVCMHVRTYVCLYARTYVHMYVFYEFHCRGSQSSDLQSIQLMQFVNIFVVAGAKYSRRIFCHLVSCLLLRVLIYGCTVWSGVTLGKTTMMMMMMMMGQELWPPAGLLFIPQEIYKHEPRWNDVDRRNS
jgi:hypothetical protein